MALSIEQIEIIDPASLRNQMAAAAGNCWWARIWAPKSAARWLRRTSDYMNAGAQRYAEQLNWLLRGWRANLDPGC